MAAENIPRRQAIPIIYTRGSHYDVGFDVGRTFGSMISNFLELSGPLKESYLPLYDTPDGKNAYNATLEAVKSSFPQYIRELEGIAEGAKVDFHKLFLLHMDDILPQSLKKPDEEPICNCKPVICTCQPTGCSTIIMNGAKNRVLGHTEDALSETLNNCYLVVAHIINDEPQGKYQVKEERFMSLCYAGHLPGYTMSHNHHGLVFTINTLSAEVLRSGKTPRHFITRALLAADNYNQAIKIIEDEGVGAGDGCSINLTFINDPSKICYNIEMAPATGSTAKSVLDIKEVPVNDVSYHTNKYERIKIQETNQFMQDSSIARMNTFAKFKLPETTEDVIEMLGDQSGGLHCVFRENGSPDEKVKTIAVGVFDLNAKTIAIYSDNPKHNGASITLPMLQKT